MELTLSLPEEKIGGDTAALREYSALELAVALYSKGVLPVGKAMQLAGLTRRDFWQCFKDREISMPLDETEIEHELSA
jgi:predicted HTH domain antitoxin